MADETLDRIVAQVRAAAPELGERRILEVSKRLRFDLGGSYVAKARNPTKVERIAELRRQGVPLREAARKVGASRVTAWRALYWKTT